MQVVLSYPGRPTSGRSRFDVKSAGGTAGGRLPASRFRPCGFTASRKPCAARAAGNHCSHRSGRVMRRGLSFARRSATRSPNPHATGPDPHRTSLFFQRCAFDPATLMGFMHPSQSSPLAGPGVCESRCIYASDAPPFIPTCRYPKHFAPLIFTVAGARFQTPSKRAS